MARKLPRRGLLRLLFLFFAVDEEEIPLRLGHFLLHFDELGVDAAFFGEKLVVGADLGNTTFFQNDKAVRAAEGEVALIYEPRRGGVSAESASGGRMCFVACAVLGAVEDDPLDPTHAYVRYMDYEELPVAVPLAATGVSAKAIQQAVLRVDMAVVDTVFQYGMAPLFSASADTEGLTERALPTLITERPVREVIFNQLVRDRAFRFNVVDKAYRGACAMSAAFLT